MSSTFTSYERQRSPPPYHEIVAQSPAPTRRGTGISVQFEKREVAQMYKISDLFRTKAGYPQESIWYENEIAQLEELYDMLQEKFNSFPNHDRARSMDRAELAKLGIQYGHYLKLKPKEIISPRLAQTDKLGETRRWSADGLSDQLSLLEGLVKSLREAPANQSWISAYFHGVAAMLPPEAHMVLKLERADSVIPLTDTPGSVNCVGHSITVDSY
ncbi:hypothetical protein D9619_007093 [Psilocybe cf. subviscida]|uniref:Uncharacterized protein n=1 Tax=Psilocybe cf. subviscida TaxID=2480587 RepID=A0A8H5B289_9AGAR|nr:hypothetical protein D9619_007093 [Psilocybe cf. subviscida]